jgi:predicted O-linked N-acetylglucosamine transferase (SPINDLY family)
MVLEDNKTFEDLVVNISKGNVVAESILLPFLCSEAKEKRCEINARLASAYTKAGKFEQARVFIQRAWVLSGFSSDLVPLYNEICSSLGDIASIRDVYKRLGLKRAAEGDISGAIHYFDLWQYAYATFNSLDRYEYDFDILESMDRLAGPYRFPLRKRTSSQPGRRTRLAYLVKGVAETGSVLLKIIILFARFHNRSRFELTFFTPETEKTVQNSPTGKENLKLFESCNCKVILAPDLKNTQESILRVGRRIYEAKPDILITSAALADFKHYFLISLHPTPITIGFIQGPPPQFAPLSLDWGIAWVRHPLTDCPVGCSLVDLEEELPRREDVVPYERHQLNLPEEGILLLSGGRYVKFQDPEFWKAIIDVLGNHPHTIYIVVGVQENQLPFLPPMVPAAIKGRIRFFDWRKEEDYLKILCLADILIDTFPSGGGAILLDAMSLGIPVVSFENNYMKRFDQTDWSVAQEIVSLQEVIVPRRDFVYLKKVISRLIEDKGYRQDISERCRRDVHEKRGNPRRMVERCEEIYVKLIERKPPKNTAADMWREVFQRGMSKITKRLCRAFANKSEHMTRKDG